MARGKQVVILDGPGGYGKTTFGEQLLTSAELAAARVRLTGASDGAGLVEAIVRASRRAGLSDLAKSAEGSSDGAIDRLLGALSQRADPVVLMVDEAHLLSPDGVDTLADLASDLPSPCRLIIAGRRIPAGRYGRPGRMVVIDATALRFDIDEIADLVGADAADPLVADIVRATDRWPAAVALAVANLDSDPSWSPDTRAGQRRIVESLLDQLLSTLSPAMRAALSTLARFPLMDAEIIEHVGGAEAPAVLFEIGLPMQQTGRWSVISDAIRESLRADETPDAALSRWVASHYVDAGELAVAVSLLAGEGQSVAIAELLAGRHWSEFEALGLGTVRVLIEMIDREIVEHPQALLNAVWAADRRDHVLKTTWIANGLAAFPEGAARRALLAEDAIEAARSGDMAAAESRAAETLDCAAPDEGITRGRASIAKGMAHAFRSTPSELRKAEVALDDAIAHFRVAGETRWEAYALERSAYLVSFKRGAFTRAAEQLEDGDHTEQNRESRPAHGAHVIRRGAVLARSHRRGKGGGDRSVDRRAEMGRPLDDRLRRVDARLDRRIPRRSRGDARRATDRRRQPRPVARSVRRSRVLRGCRIDDDDDR